MKTTGSLLSLAFGLLCANVEANPAPQAAPKCSHNNCLRAVIAGSFPNRPTVADCSSFLLATVTPATHTETVWETVTPVTETATSISTTVDTQYQTITAVQTIDVATETVTATVTAAAVIQQRAFDSLLDPKHLHDIARGSNEKRQVTVVPSAIPTYATACKSAAAYSSACSCIGVTAATTTVATPTTTVTSTSTVTAQTTIGLVETATTTVPVTVTETESRTLTAMATVTLPAIPERFYLRLSGSSTALNDQLVNVELVPGFNDIDYLTAPGPSAAIFTLDSSSFLSTPTGRTLVASIFQSQTSYVYAMSQAQQVSYAGSYAKTACSISPTDFKFTCAPNKRWAMCPGLDNLALWQHPDPASVGCEAVEVFAERA